MKTIHKTIVHLTCAAWSLSVIFVLGCQAVPSGDESKSKFEPALFLKEEDRDDRAKPKQFTSDLPPERAAEACIATAEQLERAGHLREAITLYQRAQSHDPGRMELTHRIAVLSDLSGDHAKAARQYEKALQETPKNTDLLNDYGYYHLSRHNLDQAERLFQAAIEMDSSNQRAQVNLARVWAMQGRYNESFDLFAEVVGPAAAHSNLGVILAKEGDQQAARQAFMSALSLDPTLEQPKAFLDYWSNSQ